MKTKKLKLKKGDELPFNYLLTDVEEMDLVKEINKEEHTMIPLEYCKEYKAELFVKKPYKKIVEY